MAIDKLEAAAYLVSGVDSPCCLTLLQAMQAAMDGYDLDDEIELEEEATMDPAPVMLLQMELEW